MTAVKFDSHYPMPDLRKRRGVKKYFFEKMNVGQSQDGDENLRVVAYQFASKNPPFRFASKKIGENLYRVWRIS